MSRSSYDKLQSLRSQLREARSGPHVARLLREILDAHVTNVSGSGTYALACGETIYDPEDLLGIGATLAARPDVEVTSVPIEWLEEAPSESRLYVLGYLLHTLWGTAPPSADHVERLLDAFEAIDAKDAEVRDPLLGALQRVDPDPAFQARIRALLGEARYPRAESRPPAAVAPLRPDARLPTILDALASADRAVREAAASALDDLLQGDVDWGDYALVVSGLLRQAAHEADIVVLESVLNALGAAADRPDSDVHADWLGLPPLLDTVTDPECLAHVLTALGSVRKEVYRTAIAAFREHPDARVREAAQDALAELDHAR